MSSRKNRNRPLFYRTFIPVQMADIEEPERNVSNSGVPD